MTTLVTQVWFVIERDGTIRSAFQPPRPSRNGGDVFGPYDLVYDAPQEVEDAASAQVSRFQDQQADRANRRVEGEVRNPPEGRGR